MNQAFREKSGHAAVVIRVGRIVKTGYSHGSCMHHQEKKDV
jgi:hypothetical protein